MKTKCKHCGRLLRPASKQEQSFQPQVDWFALDHTWYCRPSPVGHHEALFTKDPSGGT